MNANDRYEELKAEAQARLATQAAAAPVKKRHHKGRIFITAVVALGIILVVGIVLAVNGGSSSSPYSQGMAWEASQEHAGAVVNFGAVDQTRGAYRTGARRISQPICPVPGRAVACKVISTFTPATYPEPS